MAGGVISRERVIAINIGIVKADCPSRLKGYGGYQEMGAIWRLGDILYSVLMISDAIIIWSIWEINL